MKKVLYIFIQVVLYVCVVLGCFYAKRHFSESTYEIVGVGTVQQERSAFFVEINGRSYACNKIYTGQSAHINAGTFATAYKVLSEPRAGEEVTCFRKDEHSAVNFIRGAYTEQKLAVFLTEDFDRDDALMLSLIIAGFLIFVLEPIIQKIRYLKQRQP